MKMLNIELNWKRNKFFIISILLIALLLFTSCTTSTTRGSDAKPSGFFGVEVDFLREPLKDVLRPRQPVPISLFVVNKGYFELKVPGLEDYLGVYIYFDINKKYFSLESVGSDKFSVGGDNDFIEGILNLHGKSIYNSEGEQEIVNLAFLEPIEPFSLAVTSDIITTQLNLHYCYPYQTKLESEICVDTTSRELTTQKTCEIKPKTFSSGQGAPISIEKVVYYPLKEDDGSYKMQIFIYLVNKGKGNPSLPVVQENNEYVPNELFSKLLDSATVSNAYREERVNINLGDDLKLKNLCNANDDRVKKDFARVRVFVGEDELECSNHGMVEFTSQDLTLTTSREDYSIVECTYPNLAPGLNYLSPLIVKVDYLYEQYVTERVRIKVDDKP